MQQGLALALVEQGAHEALHGRLLGRQALAAEGAHRVAGEAARHVGAQRPVVARVGAAQRQFGAVEELRDARHGGHEGQRHARQVEVALQLGQQARGVVVAVEQHQHARVGVDEVEAQRLVDVEEALHLTALALGFEQALAQRRHQREVHHRGHVRDVAVVVALPALPVGHHGRVVAHLLAHQREARVLGHHAARPARQEVLVGVGIGVLADARQAGPFDPPEGVLDQVLAQQRLAGVEVGHAVDEPAVDHAAQIVLGAVRVQHRDVRVVGQAARVDPVARRQALGAQPAVPVADVVEDDVVDDADPLGARLGHQAAVILVAAEAGVDAVQVGGRVAVVAHARHGVLGQRRAPEHGEAHVGDVAEALAQALDVAAMARQRLAAVHRVAEVGVGRQGRAVPALREAVGHHQVDGVLRPEAAALRRARLARQQRVVERQHLTRAPLQLDAQQPRRRIGRQLQEHEQVVGPVARPAARQAHPAMRAQARLQRRHARPLDQELQLGVAHAHPPVGRLDALDTCGGRTRRRSRRRCAARQEKQRHQQRPPVRNHAVIPLRVSH